MLKPAISKEDLFSYPSKNGSYKLDTLKILIVSTPKTGNTWVKYLLSEMYELPIVDLPASVESSEGFDYLNNVGSRWIAHQHFYPDSTLLKWAKQNNVIFITTIRHPGDTFISLYHHSQNYTEDLKGKNEVLGLKLDKGRFEKNGIEYLKKTFFCDLTLSINWLRTGQTRVIRYEDLWRNPVSTLKQLADSISPIPLNRIEVAVEMCEIGVLRNSTNAGLKFFRSGKIGNWRTDLSSEMVEIFRKQSPYPALFAALGYTLDPADPLIDAPAQPRSFNNPFRNITHFDNGIPITSFLVKLYFSLGLDVKQNWTSVEKSTSPNSYFAWLTAPFDEGIATQTEPPILNNLAAYIYRFRPDLQKMFPDLYGQNWLDYLIWFMLHGRNEYHIDSVLLEPMYTYFLEWANELSTEIEHSHKTVPINNLAAYIYRTRPDLQKTFPDLYGQNWLDYLIWFMLHGRNEYHIDSAFLTSMRDYFLEWSSKVDEKDPYKEFAIPTITNLAAYIYQSRCDLQKDYPNLYDQNRSDYIGWFLFFGYKTYNLEAENILPVILSWTKPNMNSSRKPLEG